MIDEKDKQVIRRIQGDLPLDHRPFSLLAREIGMTEEEFLHRVQRLKEEGIIRRFGATLRHQEAGFSANAMVAWKAPSERVNDIGDLFASYREVTHCYERKPRADWPYNLYTMVHGASREQCRSIAETLARASGLKDYAVLFSEKEFKKTSMEYFP